MADQLSNHAFFDLYWHDCQKLNLIEKLDDENYTLNELEFYIGRVGNSLAHTLDTIQLLGQIPELLNNYPKKSSISSFRYFWFEVENFCIRYASLEDRCLSLINSAFHLGIHKVSSSEYILKNVKVARTNIPTSFKKIQKTIGGSRADRNEILHFGSVVPKELETIGALYIYDDEFISAHTNDKFRSKIKQVRAYGLAKALKTKKKELSSKAKKIVPPVSELCDALIPIYEDQKERLVLYLKK